MERRSFFLKEGMSQSIYGPILPVLQMGPPSRELWPVGSRLARSRRDERALPPPGPPGQDQSGPGIWKLPPKAGCVCLHPTQGSRGHAHIRPTGDAKRCSKGPSGSSSLESFPGGRRRS